ncbi:hypothetical protein AVEN_266473-1 [Araneus ventricosus]|uniref:Uncharacterized protein n=1 Tax=Araneus ventricosus TaxID=182803 RepID=A0A4Y2DZD6_ARAVE|nr:hypothetical protein AVEN_266473-1 [Araneus ventricosus]
MKSTHMGRKKESRDSGNSLSNPHSRDVLCLKVCVCVILWLQTGGEILLGSRCLQLWQPFETVFTAPFVSKSKKSTSAISVPPVKKMLMINWCPISNCHAEFKQKDL